MMADFVRQVAYKVWIKDVVNSTFVKGAAEFEAGSIDVKGLKVSRINVVGVVVDRFENEDRSYVNIVIDDSSGNLRLRSWREDVKVLEGFNVGDCVMVVGKVKDYSGEIYVVPEGVRKVEAKWLELRKLELQQEYGSNVSVSKEVVTEVSKEVKTEVSGDPRGIIIDLIEKYDAGDGAEYDSVVVKSGISEAEAEDVIKDMIREGEVFEVRTGFLKVML